MYIPAAFREAELAKLHQFLERHSFGMLVSNVDGVPFGTHLPFLLDRTTGEQGMLLGHMARANPHWQHLVGAPVMAVFSGPHAYISPTWYEAENVVPTWNYVAVHVYGHVQLIEDPPELWELLKRTVATYEQPMPQPWTLGQDQAFLDRLLQQIVGFRLMIERIEGKWKLNQNHPSDRREKVARALEAQGFVDARAIASLMRQQEMSRRT